MNKKKWIVVGAVLVVVIAVVAGILIGRGANPPGPGQSEPDKYSLVGKTAVSSNIPSETAKLLEITYKYDEGWAATGMLIIQAVMIKNNSTLTIDRAYTSLRVFDGKNGTGNELLKRDGLLGDISPGNTGSSGLGGTIMLDDLKNPRSFVITLERVTWKGTTTPTTKSSTTPTVTAKETPSQVVKKFFTAMLEGRYADAQKYSNNPSWFANIKGEYEKNSTKRAVRVVVLKEEIDKESGSATVKCTFYLADGTSATGDVDLELVNGEWKL